MKHALLFALLLITSTSSIASTRETPLHIAVASNFTATLNTLLPEFEKRTHINTIVSSASTGQLYAQILHGAPFDIFLSADKEHVARLNKQQKVLQHYTYATGQLVLYAPNTTPNTNWLATHTPNKLAIANPKTAPYGKAAIHYLKTLSTWTALQEKLVYAINISQAYHYVKSGNTEAGILALSLMKQNNIPALHYALISENLYAALHQEAARLSQDKAAKEFMYFLNSDFAKKVIREAGYIAN